MNIYIYIAPCGFHRFIPVRPVDALFFDSLAAVGDAALELVQGNDSIFVGIQLREDFLSKCRDGQGKLIAKVT